MAKKIYKPHFTINEFQVVSDSFNPLITERCFLMVQYLSYLRELLNSPIHITSYYRNPEHNRRVGGVATSLHLNGFAVDFKTSAIQSDVIRELQKLPYSEIIIYDNFYHYAMPNPYKSSQTLLDKRK